MRPHYFCLLQDHTWHTPLPTFSSSITTSNRQTCSTATDSQAFLEAPLGQHHATTVTDGHRNSNHHKGLRADKTQEWAATMTDNHKPMVLHHLVDSVCPQEAHQEAVEGPGLQDSCGPSRAQEATPMLSATCTFSPQSPRSNASANTSKCCSLASRLPTKPRRLRCLHPHQPKLRPLCSTYTRMQPRRDWSHRCTTNMG